MAARELRYEWFDQIVQEESFGKLVTAHHANDQAETVLFNLTKGTGISGLRGIPFQQGHLARPLIFVEKSELETYAREHSLEWREDESNKNEKYHRNKIRNTIIPELESINPGFISTIQKNTERFRSLELLLKGRAAEIKSKHWSENEDSVILDMGWFEEDTGGHAILEELLKDFQFSFDQISNIISSLKLKSGNQFFSKEFRLTVDRNTIYIDREKASTNEPICVRNHETQAQMGAMHFEFEISEGHAFDGNVDHAYLDFDLLKFPLKIRAWQEGDRFVPLGMRGQKKVSDFMIDEKIPVNLKERVIVLESGEDIVWIAGHRISEHFKITSKTQKVFIIKMSKNA